MFHSNTSKVPRKIANDYLGIQKSNQKTTKIESKNQLLGFNLIKNEPPKKYEKAPFLATPKMIDCQ